MLPEKIPATTSLTKCTPQSTLVAHITADTIKASTAASGHTVSMAKEMVTYTQQQVLSQSGNAMLAQAHERPQQILSLLQS